MARVAQFVCVSMLLMPKIDGIDVKLLVYCCLTEICFKVNKLVFHKHQWKDRPARQSTENFMDCSQQGKHCAPSSH